MEEIEWIEVLLLVDEEIVPLMLVRLISDFSALL
jgi:hypothetical protein